MKASAVAVLLLVMTCGCAREPRNTEPLREIYSPKFDRIPPPEGIAATLGTLWADWQADPGRRFREDVLSLQGLAVACAGFIILVVAFDWRRPRSARNVDLLLMFAVGLGMFDIMRFFDVLNRPAYVTLMDWVFWTIVTLSLVLLVRAVLRCVRPLDDPWQPNLSATTLAGLTAVLLLANLTLLFTKPPDDAGFFVNLGAQRLRERGRLPYGDPLLTGTPAAAYGPLLYVAHVPFQVMVSPSIVNPSAPARPALGPDSSYYPPPALATTMCTALFHLVGVMALWWTARRQADARTAWGITCLYCGSLAVMGVGGRDYSVAGITFASHIAPASAVLLAFAALPRPAMSGICLAVSAGLGFYPAFMAPAWLGYYWNDPSRRLRFLVAFGITCAAIAAGVYLTSRPTPEHGRLATILRDTFGHHTDPAGYGSSPFGFWGQRAGIRRALSTPLAGSGLTSPAWLMFAALVAGTFFLVRGRSPVELALAAGAAAIGATIVKPHATGTYMAWYYGLFLVGFLSRGFTSSPQKV
jgi:hypothetical protein